MPAVSAHVRARRSRRLVLLAAALAVLAAAATLIAVALEDNISFFLTPSELAQRNLPAGERVRIGGMVAQGSLVRDEEGGLRFLVTDLQASLPVRFRGVPPDLFAEGEGVIAEGRLAADGGLDAARILAKHDETYMPPEAAGATAAQ